MLQAAIHLWLTFLDLPVDSVFRICSVSPAAPPSTPPARLLFLTCLSLSPSLFMFLHTSFSVFFLFLTSLSTFAPFLSFLRIFSYFSIGLVSFSRLLRGFTLIVFHLREFDVPALHNFRSPLDKVKHLLIPPRQGHGGSGQEICL